MQNKVSAIRHNYHFFSVTDIAFSTLFLTSFILCTMSANDLHAYARVSLFFPSFVAIEKYRPINTYKMHA